MNKRRINALVLIGLLIALTCSAMAYSKSHVVGSTGIGVINPGGGVVSVSGQLTQDKVFYQGDGTVSLALTLQANELESQVIVNEKNVDMVVVLDRSGSMQGNKIDDAKQAVLDLIGNLSPHDRFALVSYANEVTVHTQLMSAKDGNKEYFASAVRNIYAGGGTNLGGGLQLGIDLMIQAGTSCNAGRVILISDGLANVGVTDPVKLGEMARAAVSKEIVVSTVGIGNDFNEVLMTSLADHGTGNYYYLDEPGRFAEVFMREFQRSRTAAATAVEVRVPLADGVSLINAAGFPIETRSNVAVFRPGNLLPGQSRKIFLTFNLPTNREQTFALGNIAVGYRHQGRNQLARLDDIFTIACVRNQAEVFASIDKSEWEEKVVQEDFNQLREEVADAVKSGKKDEALTRIRQYKAEKKELNSIVGSAKVAANLEQDLGQLSDSVNQTFAGAPSAVIIKQKEVAKEMQYKSYESRRNK
ncbi:MAG: VWA domain-containing protein [Proteobacteria bacterium]|nr:VWA domain-containing protein [Pseudomonadota bacterium]MBU1716237.1 VWA domain-containing protein [Pseudomonadota bacterium]